MFLSAKHRVVKVLRLLVLWWPTSLLTNLGSEARRLIISIKVYLVCLESWFTISRPYCVEFISLSIHPVPSGESTKRERERERGNEILSA